MTSDNTKRILIVGGGTFGLSTAYHLAKAGYRDVTVLEKSAVIPSEISAGDDLNKIIRAEYEDPRYANLALDAIKLWKGNPLFAPYYHQVGYLLANSPAAPEKTKRTFAKSLSSISGHPAWAGQITPLNTRQDIKAVAPMFDGPMEWCGYFNRLAGYAHAADALRATFAACCELGVSFRLGDAVQELVWDGERCVGAVTASGNRYNADVVAITMGACVARLIPSLNSQVTARGFSVAHVQLSSSETASLCGMPVTYARDLGYFFEPDPRTNLLKLSPASAGITNFSGGSVSLPPEDSSYIPAHDEEAIRKLLRETLPALAERPLVHKKICWIADTRDSDYVIDFVPGKEGLMVATGDSGHGFKFLPLVGQWIKKVIEDGKQTEAGWQWKQVTRGEDNVSWRVGEPFDLSQAHEISSNM